MNKLSIVLPTYNEAGNIVNLIKKLEEVLIETEYEIIVVDDNSTDHTSQVVLDNFEGDKRIKVINRKQRGLASAILTGLNQAEGNKNLVLDTDFNHDPSVIPLMRNRLKSYDLVVGSRYVEYGGMEDKLRNNLSRIYNLVIRRILKLPVHDTLSGFFMADREKLKPLLTPEIFNGYGEYFIRLVFFANKNKLRITEVPVFYKNRISGESKSRFIKMFKEYTEVVFKLLEIKK